MSLMLTIAGLWAWRQGLTFRLLAIHWTLGGVAFARPGLRNVVGESWKRSVEIGADMAMLAAFVFAVAIAIVALVERDSRAVRLAVLGAVTTWAAVIAAMSWPEALALAFSAYGVVLIAATLTSRAVLEAGKDERFIDGQARSV